MNAKEAHSLAKKRSISALELCKQSADYALCLAEIKKAAEHGRFHCTINFMALVIPIDQIRAALRDAGYLTEVIRNGFSISWSHISEAGIQ